MTSRRVERCLLTAFVVLVGLFHAFTMRAGHDWGDDFAQYVHHAKNLASGIPYAETGYLVNPRFPVLGPATYPPVFALLLAPVYAIAGLDFSAMRLVVIACFLAALLCVNAVLRGTLSGRYRAALLVLLGLNPFFWDQKDQVLSDLPFFFFAFLALRLIQKAPPPWARGPRPWLQALALGAACYLAYGTRSIGVLLIACLFASDRLRWRRFTRWSLIATLVFVASVALQFSVSHRDQSYAPILTLDFSQIGRNIVDYTRHLASLWSSAWWDGADAVLGTVFGALALVGFAIRLRRGPSVLEVFAVLYALAVLPWVATQDRYLIPLMPLLVAYAFVALAAAELRAPVVSRTASATLLLASGVGFASIYSETTWPHRSDDIDTADARALWTAVERVTAPDDVMVFQKPRLLALFAARRATGIHDARSPDETWDYIASVGARYVILGPDDGIFRYQERLRSCVEAYPERFEEAYANAQFNVYRVQDCATSAAPAADAASTPEPWSSAPSLKTSP